MKEKPPMVYVVDDDAAVRDALRFLLKSVGLPISPHVSAQEFIAVYAGQPGCLVLDIRMPGMSGLELQQHLNLHGVRIPVVFITGYGDIPIAVEAMRHGAFDFLEKPFHDQDLIDRVRRAFEKDAENRRRLRDTDRIPGRLESLTAREREVLRLVSTGKLNKVIASDLGVSRRTVEAHRAHLMEKLGVQSVAQLVRIAMDLEPQH
jgi:two-component system, LuxR family, response regulator FixJ